MTLKTIIAAAALLLATAAQGQGFHYDTVKGDPMQARLYTLGNGLRVYLSVNKEKPRL
ncbi:M16 family peptidase [Prevotella dentalis DSM 3688]|uniref:M16 family peptidase n=2 Tax=Prevotellaceae TaxID=171552 RepID=F9D4C7_PREDD|nr:M16 family peptidase [Prevotella dentalis DSM 3688]